jgi:hypothetical protein
MSARRRRSVSYHIKNQVFLGLRLGFRDANLYPLVEDSSLKWLFYFTTYPPLLQIEGISKNFGFNDFKDVTY